MEMNAAMRMCWNSLCVREPETFQSVDSGARTRKTCGQKAESVNLGVNYKVSEGDIKWFLMNSVVKLAMFVKKL